MHIEKELEAWARKHLALYHFLDLKVVSASDGVYRCQVPLCDNTANHVRSVHAACQWACAELLGGLAVLTRRQSERYIPVVTSLDIEFKQPALSDITAEAFFPAEQGQAMNAAMAADGRFDFELAAVIRDSEGEVVAETRGRYAVRLSD